MTATYATLQFSGVYNRGIPALGEISGEDVYDATLANDDVYGMLDNYNVVPQSPLVSSIWKDVYKVIQRANVVLNRIKEINFNKEEDIKKARIGEMKFIRVLMYFNLVRGFGDVPLVTDEITNPRDSFGQKRTPTQEVYN